jgi:hypothetical protein
MDADVDRYCRNLRAEMESAVLYRMLAAAELAEVYRRLASVEERPDELWRTKLREAGHEPPAIVPVSARAFPASASPLFPWRLVARVVQNTRLCER